MNHEQIEHRKFLATVLNTEFLAKHDKGCRDHEGETPLHSLSIMELNDEGTGECLDQYSYLKTSQMRAMELSLVLDQLAEKYPKDPLVRTALDILRGE